MDPRVRDLLAKSARRASPEEIRILALVITRNRRRPITAKSLAAESEMSPREVTSTIQTLRKRHGVRIGASREKPTGYFLIENAADEQAALGPYLRQIETMLKTAKRFASFDTRSWFAARLRKLLALIESE